MNLEDRGASRKELEGNQEAMVPGGKVFQEGGRDWLCQTLLVG